MSKVATAPPADLIGMMAGTIAAGNNTVFTSTPLTGSLAFGDGAGGYSPTGAPLSVSPTLTINPNPGVPLGSLVDAPFIGPVSNYTGGTQSTGGTMAEVGDSVSPVTGNGDASGSASTIVNTIDPATSGGRVRTADGGAANASNLVNYLTVASIVVGLLVALS